MTIVESIILVLKESDHPLTYRAIYEKILERKHYIFSAKNPSSVVRGNIRKHCKGIDFPSASPRKLFIQTGYTKNKEPLYDLWNSDKHPEIQVLTINSGELPEEIIHSKYNEYILSLKTQLLDIINSSDPAFFEQLVVNLLLKMGYGWDKSSSGKVTGGAGDEGIDGIISEDRLDLEKIYIQAKRYKNNNVPPSEIREFIGSMTIKGARKGVFFTSSSFSQQAIAQAKIAPNMNITLINGEQLTELLIQNEMGISKVATYNIYEVDRNFFEK
jgi:restriction system protein